MGIIASGIQKDMSLAFFWSLVFVRILQYESLTLWPVNSCPGNQSEVEAATLRLHCSDVRESINVYHCLPLSNLSGLVEFCYDGLSGLTEAGNCMVLFRETLDNHPCSHFRNGCPNAYYFPKNMYNYPACLKINTQYKCYFADPSCPRFLETSTMSKVIMNATSISALDGNDDHLPLYLIPVSLGVLLSLVAIVLIILWSRRRYKGVQKDTSEEHEHEQSEPLLIQNTVNEETSEEHEHEQSEPLLIQNTVNEVNHHESEERLPLKSDEDDSLSETYSYLEDKEFLERYQKYLEEGSVEVCPISQIIIVGEHGVGKTTLLYRLQGRSREEIDALKSTRGVECHKEKHSFIITKNQLEMNLKGVRSLAVDPIQFFTDNARQRENEIAPRHDKHTEHDKDSEHEKQIDGNKEPRNDKQLEDNTETNDDEPKENKQTVCHEEPKDEKQTVCDEESKDDKQTEDNRETKRDKLTDRHKEPEDVKQTESDKEFNDDTQKEDDIASKDNKLTDGDRESKHDKPTEHDREQKQAEYDTQSFVDMLEEEWEKSMTLKSRFGHKDDIVLDVLDFAGQGEYYASHQTYIRKDAIFILVIDTSKDFNEGNENQERGEKKSILEAVDKNLFLCDRPGVAFNCWSPKDYFYYWLKTIQTHGGSNERIIFVGTRKDQARKDFNFVRLLDNAIDENLVKNAYLEPVITDLSRYDELTEAALTEIKSKICILIDECRRENRPAKWLKYSYWFDIIKSKFPIIKIEDALEMIDHFDFEMSDIEISDMLHFFHTSGKIIFFNNDTLQDILILDIPWFIDCFKHIIADREHVEEDCKIVDVYDQKMLRTFHEKGVLEIGLYKKLLTQKGISEQYQITLGKYQSKLGMMFYCENYKIDGDRSIDGWYVPSINTQEFKPSIERFISNESSQILCFKFKDYLPYDFFGRFIVACVNSGHWHPYDLQLCKAGGDMCYCDSGTEGEEIYLFTAKRIVTVQFIGKHSVKNGQKVRQELLTIVRQLCQFYGGTIEYELGYLCEKKNGYKENSVNHFVSKRSKFCQECHGLCDWVNTESFWKEANNEWYKISTQREMGPVQAACKVYRHVVKQTTEIAADTGTLEGYTSKTDAEWLDNLVEVGRTIYDLQQRNESKDETTEAISRNINRDLKKVSRELYYCCRNLRKEIFLHWTQATDLFMENQEIPLVIMKHSKQDGEFGIVVSLKAETDLEIRHHLWLRKINIERKYEVLNPSKERKEKYEFQENKNRLLLKIKNFDIHDNGFYYAVVETETGVTVCNEIVESRAGMSQEYRLNLVAAIDLGTTYSGYAFSFKNKYEKNPRILTNPRWEAEFSSLHTMKTPTCLLLNPDQSFDSFGYLAEERYAHLQLADKHHSWYFFRRFKMMFYRNRTLSRETLISDESGQKNLPAMTVLAHGIRYLKDHLLNHLRGYLEKDDYIHWVLTFPAMWNDEYKQFLIEAAKEAGIESQNLSLAPELEAAALFCKMLPVEELSMGSRTNLSMFQPGTRFMVLDLGGGTVDVTVQEVLPDDTLKELHKESGGAWGGTKIDETFNQMLISIFGSPVVSDFKENHFFDNLHLVRDFETKKRFVRTNVKGKVHLKIPTTFLDIFEEEYGEEDLKSTILQTKYKDNVMWIADKIRMSGEMVHKLFENCSANIVYFVKKLLEHPFCDGVENIFMVGGFSECKLIQEAMKNNFKNKKIFIPEDADLAIVKGAVLFGHNY